ncbi:MAG: glycosyltransferase family 4 protein [Flavobacteriales bacterium]|nr:glycosyltransferase family 4 protein [Flavobacteriales bacterium]
MKIALLTDGIYPFVIGGMQKHSFYLCKFLVKQGVEVDLFHCVPHGSKLPEHEDVLKAMELEPDAPLKSVCIHFPRPDWLPGHYLKESYHYSAKLFELIQKDLDSYDFIYTKGFAGWRLIDEKKRKKISTPPVSVKFHGYEMYQPPASFKARFQHMILRGPVAFNNKNADYVFSYGGKITPIIQQLGVPEQKIVEIPTGIEANWCIKTPISLEKNTRSFVFLGRYERRKGVEELNEVLQKLIGELDFEVHFIGPIPPSKKIQSECIHYHGKVMEKDAIQQIMSGCDVMLTPSHSEGMPNVIMEGMARGLAIIATDVGAVPLQVDDTNGWRIPPADTQALEQAIRSAISMSAEGLMVKRKASIQRIQDGFTWEIIARRTRESIEQIIQHPSAT